MRILAGVRLGAGVKRHWGLSCMAIFGDLDGYVFENFTDTDKEIALQNRPIHSVAAPGS